MDTAPAKQSGPSDEIAAGQRFEFGKNWRCFLGTVTAERLAQAEQAHAAMLGDIRGKTFLDIGCGSGLPSLAAHRLGARVRGFDYDPQSVACTRELQTIYGVSWPVEEGSVLDRDYLTGLGTFDIVYSWGVLHHTGHLHEALANVAQLVRPGGQLFIAVYNDQGWPSLMWGRIKRLYNRTPRYLRWLILIPAALRLQGPSFVKDLLRGAPLRTWRHGSTRGMSTWTDIVDWVGGYPFEVAKPEAIFSFYHRRGFSLERLSTCAGGRGCNEYVFRRD